MSKMFDSSTCTHSYCMEKRQAWLIIAYPGSTTNWSMSTRQSVSRHRERHGQHTRQNQQVSTVLLDRYCICDNLPREILTHRQHVIPSTSHDKYAPASFSSGRTVLTFSSLYRTQGGSRASNKLSCVDNFRTQQAIDKSS